MIRWRQFKYVRFRHAPALLFDLVADPGEQHNLVESRATGAAAEALAYLARLAEESIDFDTAERERIGRDGRLAEQYRLDLPASTPNLYWLPSGKLVNADDPLYHPTVIAEDARCMSGA
jgi:hypothetical protein